MIGWSTSGDNRLRFDSCKFSSLVRTMNDQTNNRFTEPFEPGPSVGRQSKSRNHGEDVLFGSLIFEQTKNAVWLETDSKISWSSGLFHSIPQPLWRIRFHRYDVDNASSLAPLWIWKRWHAKQEPKGTHLIDNRSQCRRASTDIHVLLVHLRSSLLRAQRNCIRLDRFTATSPFRAIAKVWMRTDIHKKMRQFLDVSEVEFGRKILDRWCLAVRNWTANRIT